MRRPLIAALAMTLAIGLTSACDTLAPGQAASDLTMSEVIQRSVNPDGTESLRTALWHFSNLFGTLPGVTMPPAKPDPPGFKTSGTGALNSVLSHWKELTGEQQQAVAKVITVPPEKPARLRETAPTQKDFARSVIQKAVDDFVSDYTGRLRLHMRIPPIEFVLLDLDDDPQARAWTHPLAAGETVNKDTHFKSPTGGPAKRCVMHFTKGTWTEAAGGLTLDSKVAIGHEIFHCFQGYIFPDVNLYREAPHWEQDGSAEFAATLAVGTAYQGSWRNYLTQEYDLFTRQDAAMGWWFHLYELGHPVFATLPQLWQRGEIDNGNYYTAVGGADDDVYDTWAAGRVRQPGFGNAWEVHGVGVPSGVIPPVYEKPVVQGPEDVPAYATKTVRLATGEVAGIVRVSAANPIRMHDSGGFEEVHFTEGDYCLGPACTCPSKTERAGEHFQEVRGPLWIAEPGGEAGNSVVSDVMSLEDYCRKKRPERKKPNSHPSSRYARKHKDPANPHGPGGGESGSSGGRPAPASTGDPHLTSVDGHNFDFQASGEFTLIRSDSGDLEIQVRQQPRIKFDGTQSDAASMNTAVAANVAGDRVGFYADRDRPGVRVNGSPVPGEQSLPKGGKISPIEAGYSVRWPDGTEMWVINAGAPDSMSVLFGPAESRKGTLHGLIGPFDGDAMADRGGRRYGKPDFDQLYKKIGDSWRIRQADSLFDYAPGQSTDTFTRRELPVKPLTLADLSAAERAAGEKACAGVPAELHERCVFDVAVSGNARLAVGYRTMDTLTTVGGGGLAVGRKIGPQRLEPGQQRSFTIDSDADTLYFATDADCAKPTSATVYWRVTMPDGHDTLQVPMCADAGRQSTAKHGTWKIDVWVAPGAEQGGIFALHVAAAGAQRKFGISLPKTVTDGSLSGAGAEDRYQFTAAAGDRVTLTAKSTCDSNRPLYWGLESPDGNRVTLRTRACDNIGQQTIPASGTWSVAIYNSTSEEAPHNYGFTVTRP
jgi:hypothetical protein